MALIKCPECGHEISEFAPHCIFCGCPMDTIKKIIIRNSGNSSTLEIKDENKQKLVLFKDNLTSNEGRFLEHLEKEVKELYKKQISFIHRKYYLALKVSGEKTIRFSFKKTYRSLKFCFINKNGEHKEVEVSNFDNITETQLIGIIKNNYALPAANEKDGDDFLQKLDESSAAIVKRFDEHIKLNIPNFKIQNNKNTRTYFVISGKTRSKVCWFIYKRKKLMLKYYAWSGSNKRVITKTPNALDYKTIIDSIFDTKLKKIEKTVFNEDKPIKKKAEAKELQKDIIYRLPEAQRKTVDEFNILLRKKYPTIEQVISETNVLYKPEETKITAFWFSRDGNKLLLKYRKDINKKSSEVVVVDASLYHANDIMSIVDSLLKNTTIISKKEYRLLPINELVLKAIKGNRITGPSNYVKIANEVAEYTTNYIYQKYKELKRFKTREAFDQFKNKYSDYVYHGRGFSFKYPTISDAEFCFKYFIAAKLLEVIQKYERMFNEQIIVDYKELLDSYYELINNNDDGFTSVRGINSNINSVPYSVLEEELRKYLIK